MDITTDDYLKIIENGLSKLLKPDGTQLTEAMRYTALNGGKRLRPVLALAVYDLIKENSEAHKSSNAADKEFNEKFNEALTFALAVELVHNYSLIHDDLPCMDDDDFRRGLPSNHKKFGEGLSLLAGSALLTLAFEILFELSLKSGGAGVLKAGALLAEASGHKGMLAGQAVDIDKKIIHNEKSLCALALNKTGMLFKACIIGSAYIANADKEQTKSLETFAENLGLAFQIFDDLKDDSHFVKILGREKSYLSGLEHIKKAMSSLDGFKENRLLKNITFSILQEETPEKIND